MTLITGKKGFTLMEMLIVMAVVILLLGISIPFFASFSKEAKLKTAAKGITAVLNTARTRAITYRKNYSVVFDFSESPHSYYISDEEGQLYGKKYYLPPSIKLYHSQDPEHPTTFTSDKATFSSTGGLTTIAGSVWITNKKGDFRRISVTHTTGRVKIDREP